MAVTREQFARRLLPMVGAKPTKRNLIAIISWCQAEGGAARFNPLNTTQVMPGSSNYNWVGVKNYVNLDQGLTATARTLNYGAERGLYGYRPIRHRLRRNRPARYTLAAVEKSDWGTGGLAQRCRLYVRRRFDYYASRPIGQ